MAENYEQRAKNRANITFQTTYEKIYVVSCIYIYIHDNTKYKNKHFSSSTKTFSVLTQEVQINDNNTSNSFCNWEKDH